MKKISKLIVLLLGVWLLLGACSTYDDGPGFSLYSKAKRVQGRWFFKKVLYDDTDSTEYYNKGRIEFLMDNTSGNEWGLFTWIVTPSDNQTDAVIKLGGWKFNEEKDSLEMVFLANHAEDYDTIRMKINRLSYNEWWMERELDDETMLTWELWKNIY